MRQNSPSSGADEGELAANLCIFWLQLEEGRGELLNFKKTGKLFKKIVKN